MTLGPITNNSGGSSLDSGGTIDGDLEVTGNLTIGGNLNFGDASTDILTVAGYMQGSASGTTYLRVGNVTTSHSLNATDDLLIGGELEVDGTAFFDGNVGIGGAPSYPLHVIATSTTALAINQGNQANVRAIEVLNVGAGTSGMKFNYASGYYEFGGLSGSTISHVASNRNMLFQVAGSAFDATGIASFRFLTSSTSSIAVMRISSSSGQTANILDVYNNTTPVFYIGASGECILTPIAKSGASGVNGGWFNLASQTYTDNATAESGTAPSFAFVGFQQPTLAATNSSVTTTSAATLYIADAPAAGTNMTITSAYSLWVDAGLARFDGNGTDIFELPSDATANGAAQVGRIPVSIGGSTQYLYYYGS